MEPVRFAAVQALFERALDQPAAARLAFVRQACGDDTALALEVEALLRADAQPSVVDQSTPDVAQMLLGGDAQPSPAHLALGPYRLGDKLGEGGSGVVYLAERDDIGSRVAIKILRDAWVSPARYERFVTEQRTLAKLAHPAIARIVDAGVQDGAPWFAMELVEGLPLDEYCRRHTPGLPTCLALVSQLCRAVQYAHERLLVHRDLKPSNVLIQADGTPKLLDFGIAQQIEGLDGGAVHTGPLRFLTPQYAAPEELRGEPAGVRADVYSLGVMLAEVVAPIRSRLPRWTQADLDVVIATATNSEVDARYATVDAMARDLDGILRSLPLAARPATIGYRTWKFAIRHRRRIAAAATVVAVLAGLTLFYTRRLAVAQQELASASARTSRLLAFVLNLFEGASGGAPPAELRVTSLLEQGEREARSLSADPVVQGELLATLGGIYLELGDYDRAERLVADALAARRAASGPTHPDTLATQLSLGDVRLAQARLDDALALTSEAHTLANRDLPPNHPLHAKALLTLGRVQRDRGDYAAAVGSLEAAAARYERLPDAHLDLADSLTALSDTQFYAGNLEVSERLNLRALGLLRAARGPTHPDIAHALLTNGAIHSRNGRNAEAEAVCREALTIFEQWYGADHPETASALTILAQEISGQQRDEEALPLLRRALAIQQRTLGPSHPRTAFVHNTLGVAAFKLKDWETAVRAFTAAADGYGRTQGRHYQQGVSISNLGSVYLAHGDNRRAEPHFIEALRIQGESLPPDHREIGAVLAKLGRAQLRQRRSREAEPHLVRAIQILEKQPGPESTWLRSAREDLATIEAATVR